MSARGFLLFTQNSIKFAEIKFTEMEIVYRPLADMKPNPKNPRKAVDGGIEALAESIAQNPEFFEARPILLSDRTGENVIIGGERRSEAARYLGMEKAPSILFHGLTEEQEDFILLNDNTHSGKWDEDLLKQWPNELLAKWNAPRWVEHTPEDLQKLFTPSEEKVKPTYIIIEVPVGEDKESIKSIVETYVQENYPNCKVR